MLTPLGWGLEEAVEALGGCGTWLQVGLCLWACGFTVAAQEPTWAKLVWAQGTTEISRGGRGLLVAEARGLLEIRVIGRKRSCGVCWSRSLAQQCEHCNLLVPIVQMGRLRPQEAPTQEAGSPFTQWAWGMWNVWTLQTWGRVGWRWGILRRTYQVLSQSLCFLGP